MLRVKKVKNDNHKWTYWYYYFDKYDPLLKIAFLCADENPGEIICQYIEEAMLSNTQNKPCSYTLGPTVTITSNSLQETKKHLLQDIIYVETLPAYLSLVRRPRREYLCWDNKNGEKISLLEPTLSIYLSPRDIYRNKYSAILKLEFEDDSCRPTIVLTLNAETTDPIIFRFQVMNTDENLGKSISILYVWRNKIKCLKDPLFLDLSQIENKWKERDKNDGIPSQPDLLHPERKSPDMNASKVSIV
ncbi:unnamed protein product [Acanthosepion pharaonis]|uniref:Uncharacterized protein n=1 Tax=Acanthosepion pharaonis TaxID=158019 RepID=A0A812CI94_ACAPH|nr:unnamed protein product [Sepia pharaonis]